MADSSVRWVTATVKDGVAYFNQIVLEDQPDDEPTFIKLVAIDAVEEGFYVWDLPYQEVAEHATSQHSMYSRTIPQVRISRPPEYLGAPQFFDRSVISDTEWDGILAAQTVAKKVAVRKALENAGI
jgi:hypothetical protein